SDGKSARPDAKRSNIANTGRTTAPQLARSQAGEIVPSGPNTDDPESRLQQSVQFERGPHAEFVVRPLVGPAQYSERPAVQDQRTVRFLTRNQSSARRKCKSGARSECSRDDRVPGGSVTIRRGSTDPARLCFQRVEDAVRSTLLIFALKAERPEKYRECYEARIKGGDSPISFTLNLPRPPHVRLPETTEPKQFTIDLGKDFNFCFLTIAFGLMLPPSSQRVICWTLTW